MSFLPNKMTKMAEVRRTLQISHGDVIVRCAIRYLIMRVLKIVSSRVNYRPMPTGRHEVLLPINYNHNKRSDILNEY